MEASKHGQPKEFTYGDMVVLVKPHATSQDRMEVAFSKDDVPTRFKLAARLMVIGWRGLTRDGKEVPYSPEELRNVPDLPDHNFAIELGLFIWKETDISGMKDKDLKNDSRLPSNGSSEQGPSTAAGKTA